MGRLTIGVSTHNLSQATQAQLSGADYIGCGPTFPSETKSFDQFAGVEWLHQVATEIDIPAYAIGGISAANVSQVLATGVRRIVVGAAIWASQAPEEQARRLADQLG
jgi:thiamine-phosphate pyrophosphorylase